MNQAATDNSDIYEVESVLGKGGMGVVYLAHDKRLNRKVAIKCIRHNRPNEQWAESVQEEAKLLAQINHTNIVQIYDLIDWHGVPALVMEYVCGRTLLDLLNSNELQTHAFDFDQRLHWLKQIAEGLAYAHSKGIIHRDLKPENIMITTDGTAKIMDFGIARHQEQPQHANIHDSQVLPGEFVGSPGSLSPEQALGEDLTTASDVFSFGILAYSLLCGNHPFGDTSDTDTLLHSILYRAPMPFKFNVQADERAHDVANIIEQSLLKKANNRPKASDMAAVFKPLPVKEIETVLVETDSKKSHLVSKAIAAGSLLLLIVVVSLWAGQSLGLKTQYIAVLPTQFTASPNTPAHFKQPLSMALSDTTKEALLSLKQVQLIDSREWKEGQSLADIGRSTGASVLMQPSIHCEGKSCRILLETLRPPEWRVDNRKSWTVLAEQESDLYHTSWMNSIALITGKPIEGQAISDENYQRYLASLIAISETALIDDEKFEQVVAITNDSPSFMPAYKLLTQAAISDFQNKNDDKRLALVSQLLQKQKSVIDAATQAQLQANIAIALKDFGAAETELVKLSALSKTEAVYALRANVALEKNEFKEATNQYTQLTSNRPSVYNLYYLAYSQYLDGKIDDAKSTLNRLLVLDPNYMPAHSFVASLAVKSGEFATAVNALKKLITNDPSHYNYQNLATSYLLLGDAKGALESAKIALEKSPKNSVFMENLGEIYLILGNKEKAVYHLNQAIKYTRSNDDIESLTVIIIANSLLENFNEAETAILRAKNIAPDNPELNYAKALYFSIINDVPKAFSAYKTSLAQGLHQAWFRFPWFSNLCAEPEFYANVQTSKINAPCSATPQAMGE